MNLRLVAIHYSVPESIKYVKGFTDRAIEFSNEWLDSDADDGLLFVDLMANYFGTDSQKLMLVLVDDEDNIQAHLIGQIENFYGCCYLTIHHYWKNSGVELDDEHRWNIWKYIKEWGRKWRVDKVRAFAKNSDVAEVLKKYGLMDTGRVVIEAEMPEE